jgi:hypothetical protein
MRDVPGWNTHRVAGCTISGPWFYSVILGECCVTIETWTPAGRGQTATPQSEFFWENNKIEEIIARVKY